MFTDTKFDGSAKHQLTSGRVGQAAQALATATVCFLQLCSTTCSPSSLPQRFSICSSMELSYPCTLCVCQRCAMSVQVYIDDRKEGLDEQ